MKLKFSGKSAIVTGGCGGVGLKVIEQLINNKIYTLVLDIQDLPKKLQKSRFIIFKKLDVTDFIKLKQSIDSFYKKFKRVDYLINTTGVLWFDKDVSSEKINHQVWDRVLEINLKTMMYLTQLLIPKMKRKKFGSMVHISSIDALSGDDKPQDAYGVSKAAMLRLSKSLAIQFAKFNIRSNAILPAGIQTPMQKRWKSNPKGKENLRKIIPLQRILNPEDIANASMFLISEQAKNITGIELIVDGGLTSRP